MLLPNHPAQSITQILCVFGSNKTGLTVLVQIFLGFPEPIHCIFESPRCEYHRPQYKMFCLISILSYYCLYCNICYKALFNFLSNPWNVGTSAVIIWTEVDSAHKTGLQPLVEIPLSTQRSSKMGNFKPEMTNFSAIWDKNPRFLDFHFYQLQPPPLSESWLLPCKILFSINAYLGLQIVTINFAGEAEQDSIKFNVISGSLRPFDDKRMFWFYKSL